MSSVLCLFEEVNLLTSLPLSSVNGAEKNLHDHLPTQCPVTSNADAGRTDARPNIAIENVRTTRAMRMEEPPGTNDRRLPSRITGTQKRRAPFGARPLILLDGHLSVPV